MAYIVHASDLHLGAGFAFLPESIAAIVKKEQPDVVSRIVEIACDRKADAIVIAGDLFDVPDPDPSLAEYVANTFAKATCPVLIASGNHDYYTVGGVYDSAVWPENVHFFRSKQPEAYELACGTRVYGSSYRSNTRDTFEGFRAEGAADVLIYHGDIGFADSKFAPFSRKELAACGCKYVACGHWHNLVGIQAEGDVTYAYPGISIWSGGDDPEGGHICCGTVDENGAKMEIVALPGRKFMEVTMDVTGMDESQIEQATAEHLPMGAERDVYSFVLTGRIPEGLDAENAVRRIATGEILYLRRIIDKTTVLKDIWNGAGEDSLGGMFLGFVKEAYDAAETQEEKEHYRLVAGYGRTALFGEEVPEE